MLMEWAAKEAAMFVGKKVVGIAIKGMLNTISDQHDDDGDDQDYGAWRDGVNAAITNDIAYGSDF